jgi:RND family efflux transporter MFP subunit
MAGTRLSQRLAGAILAWTLSLSVTPSLAADPASVLVRTARVTAAEIADELTAYGVLDPDPDQVLSLSLPHAGLINRIWVRLGQRVKRGDRLLEVITAPDARMQYLQAESAVDFASQELQRQQRLLDERLATRAQVDAAERDLRDAQAMLEASRQRGQDSASQVLAAPMDGVVTRLDVSQGQRVQADSTALLIAAEDSLIGRLGVEPEDLPAVQPGSIVIIRSVFEPDVRIETRIRELHAMIDPATNLVEVLAPIPAAQAGSLVLGSPIRGEIRGATRPALLVPRRALLNEAGADYLFLVDGGVARRVEVQAGAEWADGVEVVGDLQAGDVVVVSGNSQLRDGMAIREQP